jgi:hypothetical protein
MIRQYKKNVGRTLIVKQLKNLEAELVEANDDFVIWRGSEEQENWKGKKLFKTTTLWRYQRSNCYSNILIKFAWKI